MVLPTVFVNYIADAAKQRVGGFDSLCSHEKSDRNYPVALFVMMKVETPGPLLGGISRASENGVSGYN